MAILLDEPEATLFARVIADTPEVFVAAPSVLELYIAAEQKLARGGAIEAQTLVEAAALRVVDWSPRLLPLARHALLSYGKGHHPARLNFGDCMVYALARDLNLPLLYKGNDFAQTDIRSALH